MENLPINIRQSINKFVKECNKILGNRLKKIILYGSYARRRLQQFIRHRYTSID